jgi:hypothetical protein
MPQTVENAHRTLMERSWNVQERWTVITLNGKTPRKIIFFVLQNETENSFFVGIKICKNFIRQNLITNQLVIILRSLQWFHPGCHNNVRSRESL